MKALPVLDPKAAAIDVGSEKLHVSIAGDTPQAKAEALLDRMFADLPKLEKSLLDHLDAQGARQ